MFKPVRNYLEKAVKQAGIKKQIEAFQICQLWNKVAEEMFGEKISRKTQAIRFKNEVLTVAVLSSILAQELKFKEEEIKEKINQKAGGKPVKKIRFEI